MTAHSLIAAAIDASPLNRGLVGADWVARTGNVPIVFDNGDLALFDDEGGGTFQVHFLFVSRGRAAIEHAKDSFRRLFEKHGATLIFGLTPLFLRHARLMARWAGGKSAGVRDTPNGPCELFVLSREMWSAAL